MNHVSGHYPENRRALQGTAIINETAFLSLEAPVERVTGFDVPFPQHKLENYYLPNTERIVKAIEKVANF
jgi:pyruvate dehydrogenase E1 component beta subunit